MLGTTTLTVSVCRMQCLDLLGPDVNTHSQPIVKAWVVQEDKIALANERNGEDCQWRRVRRVHRSVACLPVVVEGCSAPFLNVWVCSNEISNEQFNVSVVIQDRECA